MKRLRNGFTLIELLVVISIIALLIGILLPALGSARGSAQAVLCLGNMKQLGVATTAYAQDFDDRIWVATEEWAQKLNTDTGRYERGVVFEYVSNEEIFECPKNKRRPGVDHNPSAIAPLLATSGEELNFDYTRPGGTGGALLGAEVRVYQTDRVKGQVPNALPDSFNQSIADRTAMTEFAGVPVFIEESEHINNSSVHDGRWSNTDQFGPRHDGKATIALLDGQAIFFEPSQGKDPESAEPLDFIANDLFVRDASRIYHRIAVGDPSRRPYGWINRPKVIP
ncbi:MAG: prepilin-type N-terminal cleavage/methylation domain-containing protein [Planctomycetota bacterium]